VLTVAVLGSGVWTAAIVAGADATTPPFSATWLFGSLPGHIIITETNNSGNAVTRFQVVFPSGVTVTSGTVTNAPGWNCVGGTGPLANTLECASPTVSWPGNGAKLIKDVVVTGLSGTPTINEIVTFADTSTGTFEVPYGPPTSSPPPSSSSSSSSPSSSSTATPAPTAPANCKCNYLFLANNPIQNFSTADKGSGRHEVVTWRFVLVWDLDCTEGTGGCKGTLNVAPPGKIGSEATDARVAWSSEKVQNCKHCYLHFKTPQGGQLVECATDCGRLEPFGESLVEITGGPAMNAHSREGETVHFQITANCDSEKPKTYKVALFFGAFGKLAHVHVTR
jgi:hypothetical protein